MPKLGLGLCGFEMWSEVQAAGERWRGKERQRRRGVYEKEDEWTTHLEERQSDKLFINILLSRLLRGRIVVPC